MGPIRLASYPQDSTAVLFRIHGASQGRGRGGSLELGRWQGACAVLLFCAAVTMAAPAQTLTTLLTFDGSNGSDPYVMALVQGTDGNFYGTTSNVQFTNGGTVFKTTAAGTLTTLYNFCPQTPCVDGTQPYAAPILGIDGNFYGTTHEGGVMNHGTVFKMTPGGALTTLYSFCLKANCADGYHPHGVLVQATDGNFYGTTKHGGANAWGTVFKITPSGTLTTIYSFNVSDGANPTDGLIQASDGNLYGTTGGGGNLSCSAPNGCGTVFKITTGGQLTTLHNFSGVDGATPVAGVVQASDGNLYGTTQLGGTQNMGAIFKITTSGTLTPMHNFNSGASQPLAGLIQATDGNFYGTTSRGGNPLVCAPAGCGTVFMMTPGGTVTTLHTFDLSDGSNPDGGLLQGTDGTFYGTTQNGGSGGANDGTLFSLSVGLGPFVSLQRYLGKVNQPDGVLGQGFTGTSGVFFNGTPANYTVVSDTYLTTKVPAGAETGSLTVITPGGTLTSNRPFRVTPQVLSFSPPSGAVGTVVTITGVSLTQALGVGFGDYVPAKFTVNSDTQVTATVPKGAKTGPVGIETPGGIGISTTKFTVMP